MTAKTASMIAMVAAIALEYPISKASLNLVIRYSGSVMVELFGPPAVIPAIISTMLKVQMVLSIVVSTTVFLINGIVICKNL